MNGVLVVDKPAGMTSHDVVATARRALGESRIGHTGTLDPMATGVLPLAIGRATRLVQFLTASDKEYVAEIRLGLTTDTYDVTGAAVAETEPSVTRDDLAAALQTLMGDYLQAPPPYSAKKIGNRRAYDLARAGQAVQPAAVPVSVRRLELTAFDGVTATVEVTCSAGFYVRALAHEVGLRLRTGGCLAALRRTRSGEFALAEALRLETVARDREAAAASVIPLERLLIAVPAVTVTEEGERRVSHGRDVEAAHLESLAPEADAWVRLLKADGALLAVARPRRPGGSLHPSVVLI
jgi:tRNA pseudouridine55 synthase